MAGVDSAVSGGPEKAFDDARCYSQTSVVLVKQLEIVREILI